VRSASAYDALRGDLSERILVLDGAYGTLLQSLGLAEEDYRGEVLSGHNQPLKGNHDVLALTRPEVVAEAHDRYLRAGADIIKTNTFTSTRLAQADYGLEDQVGAMNQASAAVARTQTSAASPPVTTWDTSRSRRYAASPVGDVDPESGSTIVNAE